MQSPENHAPNPSGIDCYSPPEIYALVDRVGVKKAQLGLLQLLALSVLAGAFIALGCAAYTMVMTGADPSFGPSRLLGGVVFCLGLILVVVAGAELFTGNALIIIAAVDGLISPAQLLRNWLFVFLGNFLGALIIAALVWWSGMLAGPFARIAADIAEAKSGLGMGEAFARGVLCNILVCLAVWLSLASRSTGGKILAIVWPISCFVLLGLEHSIANMYFFPQAMLAGASVDAADFARNLAAVSLGNIVGGAGGVSLAYRLAYGQRRDRP